MKSAFAKLVKNYSQNYNVESQSSTEISMNITKMLKSATESMLLLWVNENRCNKIWKNNQKFN